MPCRVRRLPNPLHLEVALVSVATNDPMCVVLFMSFQHCRWQNVVHAFRIASIATIVVVSIDATYYVSRRMQDT